MRTMDQQQEGRESRSSVELSRNAKGEWAIKGKVYAGDSEEDVKEAQARAERAAQRAANFADGKVSS